MRIKLVTIGKTDQSYIRQGILEYMRRLEHFVNISVEELPDVRNTKNMSNAELQRREGEILQRGLSGSDVIILLDEKGQSFSSREMAAWLNKILISGPRELAFVCGGAFGFSEDIYKLAHYLISLSRLTFTHQMARLIFLEQLYRSFTILKGMPYHND